MEINKINVNGTSYDIQDSRVNATDIATMLDAANYVPSAASSGTTYIAGTGINISANNEISIDNTVITTSNISSNKPSYSYSEIGYALGSTTTSAGGSLSLDGTTPVHVVTLTGNVSALSLSSNPPAGHSCHVIFTATSEYTVAIAHDSTNRVCPEATDLSFTVPANGYVEIDFLNANSKIYVRGV